MEIFMNSTGNLVISFGSFNVSISDPWTFAGIIVIFLLLWRWWGFKRLFLFSIIISILMVFMFQLENVIVNRLGAEDGDPFVLLIKPLFMTIAAVLFLCFSFLNREQ